MQSGTAGSKLEYGKRFAGIKQTCKFQSHKMFYGNVTNSITLGYMLCNFDSSYMSHNDVR